MPTLCCSTRSISNRPSTAAPSDLSQSPSLPPLLPFQPPSNVERWQRLRLLADLLASNASSITPSSPTSLLSSLPPLPFSTDPRLCFFPPLPESPHLSLLPSRLTLEPLILTDILLTLFQLLSSPSSSSLSPSSSSPPHLHLLGPLGVGRRTLLFQLAALLRAPSSPSLVLFLPSPSAWRLSPSASAAAFLSYLYDQCRAFPALLASPLTSPHPSATTFHALLTTAVLHTTPADLPPLLHHLLSELHNTRTVPITVLSVEDREEDIHLPPSPSPSPHLPSPAAQDEREEGAVHSPSLSAQLQSVYERLRTFGLTFGTTVTIARSPPPSPSSAVRVHHVPPPLSSFPSFLALCSSPAVSEGAQREYVMELTGGLPSHLRLLALATTLPSNSPTPPSPLLHPVPYPPPSSSHPSSPSPSPTSALSPSPLSPASLPLFLSLRDRLLLSSFTLWRRRLTPTLADHWLQQHWVVQFLLRRGGVGEGGEGGGGVGEGVWEGEVGWVVRGGEEEEEEERRVRGELAARVATAATPPPSPACEVGEWRVVDSSPHPPLRFAHPRARSLFWPHFIRTYHPSSSPFLHPSPSLLPSLAFTGAALLGLLMSDGPLRAVDLSGAVHPIPCNLRAIDWLPGRLPVPSPSLHPAPPSPLPLDVLLLLPPSIAYPTPVQALYLTLDDRGCPHLILLSTLPSSSSLAPHLVPGSLSPHGLPSLLTLLTSLTSLLPPPFHLSILTHDGSVLSPHHLHAWYADRLEGAGEWDEPVFPWAIKGLVMGGGEGVGGWGRVEYVVVCEGRVDQVVGGVHSEVTRRLNGHVRLIAGDDTRAVLHAQKDWQSHYFAHGMLDTPA